MDRTRLLKIMLPLLILFLAGLLLAYFVLTREKPETRAQNERRYLVKTEQIYPGDYQPHLLLYGRVESPQTSELESALAAYVLATHVREGDSVIKGQLLVTLDDRDTQLLLRQRKAEVSDLKAQIQSELRRYQSDQEALAHEKELLKIAQKGVERREYLQKTLAGSVAQLDDAREAMRLKSLQVTLRQRAVDEHEHRLTQLNAKLDRGMALEAQATLDLERTLIKAPFDARVTKLYVAVGERLQVGERIVQLFDVQDVEIRTQLPTKYLSRVRSAFKAKERLIADATIDGQPAKLELVRLAGEVEAGRAGVDVLFKVLEGSDYLALGRSVVVDLSLPKREKVYAVPERAVYHANTLYKVVDGRLQRVLVERIGSTVLPSGEERILVNSSQLTPGDEVLVSQLPNAISGLPVNNVKD